MAPERVVFWNNHRNGHIGRSGCSHQAAEKEMDREATLPGQVCLHCGGRGPGPAGPPEPLGMDSRMKSPREGPGCEGCFRVPAPTPCRDQRPRCTLCLWVPYCLSNHFLLFTYFDLTQSPWISLPETKQFITKTNGWNLSHLKNNPAIGRIDSPRAQTAVKCRILCGLRKCFSINYPTLDERNMCPTSITDFFLKQMSQISFQVGPNNGTWSKMN